MASSWVKYYTEKGEYEEGVPYYYNKDTGKTQWEEPLDYTYQSYCFPQKSIPDPLLPDTFRTRTLKECFSIIGVDSIRHLKRNSIQELCRLRTSIGSDEEWKASFYSNNAYLGYVVTSQFYNPVISMEEFDACVQMIVRFMETNQIAIAILLDERYGGAQKCAFCLATALSRIRPVNELVERRCVSFIQSVADYLSYSAVLLTQLQQSFAHFPSEEALRTIVFYSQQYPSDFLESVVDWGSMSSLMMSLLNHSKMGLTETEILWRFVFYCISVKVDFLYVSDCMVLVDLCLRTLNDDGDACSYLDVVKGVLQVIVHMECYGTKMNHYKWGDVSKVI